MLGLSAAGQREERTEAKTHHCSESLLADLFELCALPWVRQILGGMFALMLVQVGLCATEHNPLLPAPQEIHYAAGELSVPGLSICFASAPGSEDRFAASELAAALAARADASIPILESGRCEHGILLERTGGIDPLPVPGEQTGPDSREAYSLKITSEGATVSARSSAGLYYAIQTLGQLVEGSGAGAVLPVVEIKDWPALAYRGVMVDMSHGALPTEKEVERQLEFMACWKANQYYFYSEDSIELKGYPLFNPGGRFSQEEVRRIIAYGRARHIDVIPCLELYGHQHDLFRVEKYAELADMPHGVEFDPRNSQVNSLLTDWVTQLAQLFPSPFVHIGFDEAFQIEHGRPAGRNVGTTGSTLRPATQHRRRSFQEIWENRHGLGRHHGEVSGDCLQASLRPHRGGLGVRSGSRVALPALAGAAGRPAHPSHDRFRRDLLEPGDARLCAELREHRHVPGLGPEVGSHGPDEHPLDRRRSESAASRVAGRSLRRGGGLAVGFHGPSSVLLGLCTRSCTRQP